jgi:hypothetical protein
LRGVVDMKIAIVAIVFVLVSCGGDDRAAEDEYLGQWNALHSDASIRIDEMSPACSLEYVHGDTSTLCTESTREYRPMDNGFTNIVISCQPDVSRNEFLLRVSISDCIPDTIWVLLSYDDPSRLSSSDGYIR